MPSLSAKQHRAMGAAAGGNSNIGIPQGVGKEYMMADELRKHGNSDYGNHTEGGIHVTHWKPGKKYGGSNQGGGSIGGGAAGGG